MEKLQCTMCGSHQLLEIDNKTFECQSCGVKLKKSEVNKSQIELTNKLKSILSDEAENLIIRADEFFDMGEYDKASIYYNNALDIDAKNSHCRERLKLIDGIKKRFAVRFVKQTISKDDCVNYFLHELKFIQGIPFDIYEKLNIISIKETYLPFKFYSYSISGTFTATAIDNIGFAQPWNGHYKAYESGKIYCFSKLFEDSRACFTSEDFANCVTKQFSPDEFENLSNFNNIPVKMAPYDITEKVKKEALEKCNCSAESSVKETNIKKLNNIDLKHDEFLFDFQDVFLPVCTIKYEYNGTEYSWIISMSGNKAVCAGTYPWESIKYSNSNFDVKTRCTIAEQETKEKVENIDEQLKVLEDRIENINNEQFSIQNKMLEQVKKPWHIDISAILILYVPFIAFIGFIFKTTLIGKLILAVAIFLVAFCAIVFIRNLLIKKNSMQAQILYNQEQEMISDKAEKILSKINETIERLQHERKSIIDNFARYIDEIESQHSKPVLEEFAKKLNSDCFWFIEQKIYIDSNKKHNRNFYALPSWINISLTGNTDIKILQSEYIDNGKIKEKRNKETEYKLLLQKLLKK